MAFDEGFERVVVDMSGRVLRAREAHDLGMSREAISTRVSQYLTRFCVVVGYVSCT
jgi:hypothetical protein